MKPCWYIDRLGNKCKNSSVQMSIIEEMVLKEITNYKNQILSASPDVDVSPENLLHEQICEMKTTLAKTKKALERLNDAYEMGDYSRDEWIGRKIKRETEIYNLKKKFMSSKTREE